MTGKRSASHNRYHTKTYTCWIGNITATISESQIEDDFNRFCEKFGRFKKQITIKFNNSYQKYQCFINYYEQNSAICAVYYFNNTRYHHLNLIAQYRSEREISVPPINRNPLIAKPLQPVPIPQLYREKYLVILNSKYLQQQVNKKIEILNNIYKDKLKINIDNSGVESDFTLNLKTLDESIFNQVTQLIENSWIVSVNTFDLQVTDKKLLSDWTEILRKFH
jgi:hypothetical protein